MEMFVRVFEGRQIFAKIQHEIQLYTYIFKIFVLFLQFNNRLIYLLLVYKGLTSLRNDQEL